MFHPFAKVAVLACWLIAPAVAGEMPGISSTDIRIGGIFPFSAPASSIGLIDRSILGYVQSINDCGGINGRKINYITYDDAYSPSNTVEQARRLAEGDEVALTFSQLGTAANTATAKYLKSRGGSTIGIVSGSTKFTDVAQFPLTITGLVSDDTEARTYTKYLVKTLACEIHDASSG